MLAERDEKLDIVLLKLEQMGRELESFRVRLPRPLCTLN